MARKGPAHVACGRCEFTGALQLGVQEMRAEGSHGLMDSGWTLGVTLRAEGNVPFSRS